MTRVLLLCGAALWAGATLLLSQVRWFSRVSLLERLRPYAPGAATSRSRPAVGSLAPVADVIGPLARDTGERLARAFGVSEDVAVRLERVHSTLDVTAFRLRQLGWCLAAFAVGALLTAATHPPAVIALGSVVGPPLLAFLVVEQRLAAASDAWKRRVLLELPVVAEQLAMLLSSGYSLGTAVQRLADRGQGSCARDLRRVCARVRQGLSEIDALREWAAVAAIDAVDRLVAVLALNREAGDLGRLVSGEARAIRRDLHRGLVATAERRGQQVWVPVTVSALLPGVIFVAIPFIEALRLFSAR